MTAAAAHSGGGISGGGNRTGGGGCGGGSASSNDGPARPAAAAATIVEAANDDGSFDFDGLLPPPPPATSAPPVSGSREDILPRIRALCSSCLAQGATSAAAFYADKLLTLSGTAAAAGAEADDSDGDGDDGLGTFDRGGGGDSSGGSGGGEDALLLARCFVADGSPMRAVIILGRYGLLGPPRGGTAGLFHTSAAAAGVASADDPDAPFGGILADRVRLEACQVAARAMQTAGKHVDSLQLLENVLGPSDDGAEVAVAVVAAAGAAAAAAETDTARAGASAAATGGGNDGESLDPGHANGRLHGRAGANASRSCGNGGSSGGGGNGGRNGSGIGESQIGREVSTLAQLCCLRGQAYATLDKATRAVVWLRAALAVDVHCVTALHMLLGWHLMPPAAAEEMVAQLPFRLPADCWLLALYHATIIQAWGPGGGGTWHTGTSKGRSRGAAVTEGAAPAAANAAGAGYGRIPPLRPYPPPPPPDRDAAAASAGGAGGSTGADVADADAETENGENSNDGDERGGSFASRVALIEWVGLAGNADVLAARADHLYQHGDLAGALHLCRRVLRVDPEHAGCVPVYVATLAAQGLRGDLYYVAHQLVQARPKSAAAWHAVGSYYHCLERHELAARFFAKATKLEPRFVPAWVAWGNALSAQDESDQALSAYRTAARLFPGTHVPLLHMGMEYQRSNNLALAEHFLHAAQALCRSDPLVHNELGVLSFRQGNWQLAADRFNAALAMVPAAASPPPPPQQQQPRQGEAAAGTTAAEAAAPAGSLSAASVAGGSPAAAAAGPQRRRLATWTTTRVNLGHCYRKLGRLAEAEREYRSAAMVSPGDAGTHAALGMALHMQGPSRLQEAIEQYHRALALRPDDTFAADMLAKALKEAVSLPDAPEPAGCSGGADESGDASGASSRGGGGLGGWGRGWNGCSRLTMPNSPWMSGAVRPFAAAGGRGASTGTGGWRGGRDRGGGGSGGAADLSGRSSADGDVEFSWGLEPSRHGARAGVGGVHVGGVGVGGDGRDGRGEAGVFGADLSWESQEGGGGGGDNSRRLSSGLDLSSLLSDAEDIVP